jgi:hypothetical protein
MQGWGVGVEEGVATPMQFNTVRVSERPWLQLLLAEQCFKVGE